MTALRVETEGVQFEDAADLVSRNDAIPKAGERFDECRFARGGRAVEGRDGQGLHAGGRELGEAVGVTGFGSGNHVQSRSVFEGAPIFDGKTKKHVRAP